MCLQAPRMPQLCGQRCNSLGAYRLWGERGGRSLRASVPDGILGGVDPTLLHNHTRDLAVGVAPTVQAPDLTPQVRAGPNEGPHRHSLHHCYPCQLLIVALCGLVGHQTKAKCKGGKRSSPVTINLPLCRLRGARLFNVEGEILGRGRHNFFSLNIEERNLDNRLMPRVLQVAN